jgi:hypothetical protein
MAPDTRLLDAKGIGRIFCWLAQQGAAGPRTGIIPPEKMNSFLASLLA